jgi:hypothetical protein
LPHWSPLVRRRRIFAVPGMNRLQMLTRPKEDCSCCMSVGLGKSWMVTTCFMSSAPLVADFLWPRRSVVDGQTRIILNSAPGPIHRTSSEASAHESHAIFMSLQATSTSSR